MRVPSRLVLALATAVVLPSCDSAPTGRTPLRSGAFDLDLGPLLRPAAGALRQIPGTVIDSLALDVEQGGTPVARVGRKLARGDTVVSLPVTVPDGQTRFEARVLSSRGALLFDGSADALIRQDGFRVEIRLAGPHAPILVVRPDSLHLRLATADSSLVVENRGSGTLSWRVAGIESDDPSCAQTPCLAVQPTSGQLAAGRSDRLLVAARRTAGSFVVRFASAEGDVDLPVVVTR